MAIAVMVRAGYTASEAREAANSTSMLEEEETILTPDSEFEADPDTDDIKYARDKFFEYQKAHLLELKEQGWETSIRREREGFGPPREYDHYVITFTAEEARYFRENEKAQQALKEAVLAASKDGGYVRSTLVKEPHFDTANPHVHVLIHRHGVDVENKRIANSYDISKKSEASKYLQRLNEEFAKRGLPQLQDFKLQNGQSIMLDARNAEIKEVVAKEIEQKGGVSVMRADAQQAFRQISPEAENLAKLENEARAQAERLAAEKARIEAELQQRLELVVLAQQAQAALVQKKELEKERDKLAEQLNTATHERDALVNERDALASERDALAQERDAIASENAQLTERVMQLSAERDAIASERDALAQELAQELDDVRNERDEIAAERDELEQEVERLNAVNAELESRFERANNERSVIAQALEEITQERDKLLEETSLLEQARQQAVAERDALREQTAAQKELIALQQAQLQQMQAQLQAMQQQMQQLQEQMQAQMQAQMQQMQAMQAMQQQMQQQQQAAQAAQQRAESAEKLSRELAAIAFEREAALAKARGDAAREQLMRDYAERVRTMDPDGMLEQAALDDLRQYAAELQREQERDRVTAAGRNEALVDADADTRAREQVEAYERELQRTDGFVAASEEERARGKIGALGDTEFYRSADGKALVAFDRNGEVQGVVGQQQSAQTLISEVQQQQQQQGPTLS